MELPDSCIRVLLQCRDRDWFGIGSDHREAWAWEAADRCLEAGFAVLRVRTDNWNTVKADHPEWLQPCFKENLNKQQVICIVNYIHVLCPALQEIQLSLEADYANVANCSDLEIG